MMSDAPDTSARYWSTIEVGAYFGRHRNTIARWSNSRLQGFPKPVMLGDTPAYVVAEILDWEASRREARTQEQPS